MQQAYQQSQGYSQQESNWSNAEHSYAQGASDFIQIEVRSPVYEAFLQITVFCIFLAAFGIIYLYNFADTSEQQFFKNTITEYTNGTFAQDIVSTFTDDTAFDEPETEVSQYDDNDEELQLSQSEDNAVETNKVNIINIKQNKSDNFNKNNLAYHPTLNKNLSSTPTFYEIPLSQQQQYEVNLSSKSSWIRHKTILLLRKQQSKASIALLSDHLQQKKFWARMWTLISLADLQQDLSSEQISNAITGVHQNLIANFFKRFADYSSPGIAYIQRLSLNQVNSRTRYIILNNLNKHKDSLLKTYLVAATFDTSIKVQQLAQKGLAKLQITSTEFDSLRQSISSLR